MANKGDTIFENVRLEPQESGGETYGVRNARVGQETRGGRVTDGRVAIVGGRESAVAGKLELKLDNGMSSI
jgi:hypothetical protein